MEGPHSVLHLHQLGNVFGGAGVNDVAPGYFINVPTGDSLIVGGGTDPHAAHQHLVGVSLLLQYPVSSFEDCQLGPAHLGLTELDASGFRLGREVTQGSVPGGHMGYHRPPSIEVNAVSPCYLQPLLHRFHARHKLRNGEGQGIIGSDAFGRQPPNQFISLSTARTFDHDVGAELCQIQGLGDHLLRVEEVPWVYLPGEIPIFVV